MRQISDRQVVNCDIETFWKTFLDEGFSKELHMKHAGAKDYEVLERTDTKRRLRIVPQVNMPGPIKKLLGDRFAYEEVGELDRERNTWTWHLEPSSMRDKLTTKGVFRLEPKGEGKCERIDEATIEAKIFGVGKLFEGTTEGEVRGAWAREVKAIHEWLAK